MALFAVTAWCPFIRTVMKGQHFAMQPCWVLNVHGVIGRGTRSFLSSGKHRAPVHRHAMGLNYLGNTWGTHCLIATMMKCVASPETLKVLLSAFAADVKDLLHTGITNGAERVWTYHLAAKGDLPAISKIGNLPRTFGHAPRAARSRKPCRGVCWLCLAGQERDDAHGREALPYKDMSMTPCWEPSIHKEHSVGNDSENPGRPGPGGCKGT